MPTYYQACSSALRTALFLLVLGIPASASMPLTETIYTIPESGVELVFHEEYVNVDSFYRKEHIELGFGLVTDLTIWFKFDYLHNGAMEMSQGEVGDLFLKLWYYIGDYCNDMFHMGWFSELRFPTGKNAYTTREWRNLALGNYEITLGLVCQIDLIEKIFMHVNVLYTFRQGRNENFYGGFFLNPVDEETYSKLFGLNPFADDTFLSYERLKNDYITLAVALNTDVIYPFVPYVELYGSFRPFQGSIETDNIPIEGAGVNAFLIGAGIRYFFLRAVYLGIYAVVNPLMDIQEGYITNIIGIDLSYQF